MKKIITIGWMLCAVQLSAQTHTEKITKEFTFEKKGPDNALFIANINGSVVVEGYTGDKILVEVSKTIHGKTDARLQKGKQEIQLGSIDRADTLIFYVEDGCSEFGKKTHGKNRNEWFNGDWGYTWCCNNNQGDCSTNCRGKSEYDYKMDFKVKVPSGVHVRASTINEGDILVSGIKGTVNANNINGHIKLVNLVREAEVHTINGNVDVEYSANPKEYCRFYTLNGDINAWFKTGLAANLSFKSFNGSFYTNIDKLEQLPASVEKNPTADGIKYKVDGNRFKVGSGGVLLDFETFNGNVYLKEKVN
jgi:DUF4097 and DUF4098 domain-containing protein YvlB